MIFDPILLNEQIPIEAIIRCLREELEIARTAKPHPHIVCRVGLSFTEQMLKRRISPSQLGASTDELMELEREGAILAIKDAVARATSNTFLIESTPTLLKFVQNMTTRYKFTLAEFNLTERTIELLERAYWFEHGRLFVKHLREIKDLSKTIDVLVWELHEIRLAKTRGGFSDEDLGLTHKQRRSVVRHIQNELKTLTETYYDPATNEYDRKTISVRYHILVMIAKADLAEFPA
ncbi:hypothetical protein A3C09_00970 [Candidatus Uhrbacteria bacterium RIFCSPHIGHO2_02_FULL_47_44]|uniref:Uncharacterized protein n=1 Tax=Candidatus Uhrbacteria bacterium RIFCSPLOWO2_02_FULL_48_18 TaxID=1802408 RepID=A0A1F7V828_9BACT|nr:MAG: hypothetical protein A2839_02845 [Candidatus Uhrbacteria bacterium RIFCSPHIGHO2_01_FULL_47_10]OGL70665.1 MAG: hypothetical protein A3C09_00970 [Candidatus Uhrbacteria bacterium RIFCSPHIGHO2_02_FULL_47_44]OGL75955.1 MAG: hypothetical protein A3E97_04780 [Candidatus Uhrbacteria bacterium RIFCSPHIGHO2_12_FULL_47_12]OGL82246.1 MAG: hypothetical protein A3B20_00645 [Candidatus Uhrbacteria bacterium RIFCSPLOWO2_01_FULL_47_17]OGL86736.1 MAG: hypothetical protein A3I41_05410 [Candidatus Uhrbact